MNRLSFACAAVVAVGSALQAQDVTSMAHARVLGDDSSGVEIYYHELYTGGDAYLSAMAAVGQETTNKDLYTSTGKIPDAVNSLVLATWKLKEQPDGTMVPTGEKVNGKAPPPGVALVPTTFYKSGKFGVYFASLIDQVAKKSYGMPVMWLTLRQGETGWEQEANKAVAKVINNTAMVSPSSIKAGKPQWLDRVGTQTVIGFELDASGDKYIRSKKPPSTTTLAFIGGYDFGQSIRVDAPIPAGVITDPSYLKITEQASKIIFGAWSSYQNAEVDNQHWITDTEVLKEGKVTGKLPVNGLQLRTTKTPPSIFYILQASPYIVVGLSYVNAPQAIQWAFLHVGKDDKISGILDNAVLLQERELILTSSILKSLGDTW